MKRYYITGTLSVTCYTEVDANSPEEALEIASYRNVSGLCHAPFLSNSDEEWNFDNDGEPFDISINNEEEIFEKD
jgi:hypothetical protein